MWLVAGVVLSLWQHSSPSITGIITSQMIMSGTTSCALRRPSRPSAALRTRYFSASSVRRKRRMSVLSSMISAMGLGSSSRVERSSWASSISRSRAEGSASEVFGIYGMVCCPSATGLAGSEKVKTEPVPVGWFSARMVPPCSSTKFLASARPRPVPSKRREPTW